MNGARSASDLIAELDEAVPKHRVVALAVAFEHSSVLIYADDPNRLRLLNEAVEAGGYPAGLIAIDYDGREFVTMTKVFECDPAREEHYRVYLQRLWLAKIAICLQISEMKAHRRGLVLNRIDLMLCLLRVLSVLATQFFRYRRDLLLENLALRQQLAVWKRRRPQLRLSLSDKLFWVTLRRVWAVWKQALIVVQPETRRSFDGTEQDSSCIGLGFRGNGSAWEENESAGNCAISSSAWLRKIQRGVHCAFMGN